MALDRKSILEEKLMYDLFMLLFSARTVTTLTIES